MDTVLIVDDSSFIVEGLIAFLKKKYRPIPAHGGAECLELLKRETPSVIILDIMMDPMDGWETLAHIKENPETRHIPVIMFSAIKISPEEAVEHHAELAQLERAHGARGGRHRVRLQRQAAPV